MASDGLEEAHLALRDQEAAIDRLAQSPSITFTRRRFDVRVDDVAHEVTLGFAELPAAEVAPVAIRGEVQTARGTDTTRSLQLEIAGRTPGPGATLS